MKNCYDFFILYVSIYINKEAGVLKRYQVMLPDWLEDYVKFLADGYDSSFSEILRAEICWSILASVSSIYPEYKSDFKLEDVFKNMRDNPEEKNDKEKLHRAISKMCFEARKAAEYRLVKEKKLKKK